MSWLMTWLDGKKTKISGISGILASLAALLHVLANPPIVLTDVGAAIAGILASLAVLGIGGKMQKIVDAGLQIFPKK